ncbi:isopentenyl-diphosphate delta-isomerase idi1 [Binucleata daphniae]
MDNAKKFLCLVNDRDNIIDTEMAIVAHLKNDIRLHRAFSVFIFNSAGKLLVQKRSEKKLVFPGPLANSCCSHPFINDLSFTDPVLDCKKHAIERIKHELGIESIKDLHFFERILYYADDAEKFGRLLGTDVHPSEIIRLEQKCKNNEQKYVSEDFAEYEVDYLFWCICDEVPKPNPNEIDEVRYVNKEEFDKMLQTEKCSPWLSVIIEHVDVFNIYKRK